MASFSLKDRVKTALATGVGTTDTLLTVDAGDGAQFPVIPPGGYTPAYLETALAVFEKVHVTARTGDALTVSRAQGGTAAQVWDVGTSLVLALGSEELEVFRDFVDMRDKSITYDSEGRVATVTYDGVDVWTLGYGADDQVLTFGNGTYLKTFTYNPDGTVAAVTVT